MQGRLYVGSSLRNGDRARQIMDRFESEGVQITYDWTAHGQVYNEDELIELGILEEKGVLECDVFLLVFPGRNGSHFELGLARGTGKHIVLLEEVEVERKTFYHLPRRDEWPAIVRFAEEDDAVQYILAYLGSLPPPKE